MNTIDKSITKQRQSTQFLETFRIGEHVLRVNIKSDSYAFQSHAKISRFNGESWKTIHWIDYADMKTPSQLCYRRNEEWKMYQHYRDDRNRLVDAAKQILQIKET